MASKSGGQPGERTAKAAQESGSNERQSPCASTKPPRPSQCRNFTREAVAQSLPEIVGALVGEAKKGSVPHLNLLSKLGGFDQRPVPAPVRRRGKSFAHRLLEDMKQHEAKMIAANEARLAAERAAGR